MFSRAIRPIQQQSNVNAVGGAILTLAAAYGAYSFATWSSNGDGPRKTFGRGPAFVSLRLDSVETLTHDTKQLRFALPEKDAVSGLELTSALLTFSRPESTLFPVVRPYTPVSDFNESGYVDLCVKKYPNGKASTHLHSLKPGDSLFILGRLSGYSWKLNESPHVVLIAGGAGITPIYQLLRGILNNPQEQTKITLIHGINTEKDALFDREFTQYEKEFPDRFKRITTVTNPSENSSTMSTGRVTRELLERVLPLSDRQNTKVFCCGPPAMETTLCGSRKSHSGILGELGFTKDQVFRF